MLSPSDMSYHANCGELAFICCLTQAQLEQLRDWLSGMSDEQVKRLHKIACTCTVGTPAGKAPSPGTGPGGVIVPKDRDTAVAECVQRFNDQLCGEATMTIVTVVDETLGVFLVIAKEKLLLVPQIAKPLFGLWLVLGLWRDFCQTKTIPGWAVQFMCDAWDILRKIFEAKDPYGGLEQLPGSEAMLKPLKEFWSDSRIINWIDMCCGVEFDDGEAKLLLDSPATFVEKYPSQLRSAYGTPNSPEAPLGHEESFERAQLYLTSLESFSGWTNSSEV